VRKWFTGTTGMVVTFLIGVVVASAATAGAASVITSKQIKNGTITSKDLSKAVRRQLAKAGVPGPIGAQGLSGATGATGATGAAGATGLPGRAGSPDSAAQVLAKLATVDGSGSGLDADLLGGQSPDAFQKRGTATACSGTDKATGIDAAGDLTCGADVGLTAIISTHHDIDPPSVAANTCDTFSDAMPGMVRDDHLIMSPPPSVVASDMIITPGQSVNAADTIRVQYCNLSASAIDLPNDSWGVLVITP
jgi:hypothetical protein